MRQSPLVSLSAKWKLL